MVDEDYTSCMCPDCHAELKVVKRIVKIEGKRKWPAAGDVRWQAMVDGEMRDEWRRRKRRIESTLPLRKGEGRERRGSKGKGNWVHEVRENRGLRYCCSSACSHSPFKDRDVLAACNIRDICLSIEAGNGRPERFKRRARKLVKKTHMLKKKNRQ